MSGKSCGTSIPSTRSVMAMANIPSVRASILFFENPAGTEAGAAISTIASLFQLIFCYYFHEIKKILILFFKQESEKAPVTSLSIIRSLHYLCDTTLL
jgi:hypothetical protein